MSQIPAEERKTRKLLLVVGAVALIMIVTAFAVVAGRSGINRYTHAVWLTGKGHTRQAIRD